MDPSVIVLIADSDPATLSALDHLATALSFKVVAASSLSHARIAVATSIPTIAILNGTLADGQSSRLVREIRGARLPMAIAMMVDSEDDKNRPESSLCGVDRVFNRPLDSALIGRWLKSQGPAVPVPFPCADPAYADRQICGSSRCEGPSHAISAGPRRSPILSHF